MLAVLVLTSTVTPSRLMMKIEDGMLYLMYSNERDLVQLQIGLPFEISLLPLLEDW